MNDQPPGWHPDPWLQAEQRWWDGTNWTEQTRSAPVPPPPQPHSQPQAQPRQQAGIYQPPGAVVPHDVNRVVAALFALFLGGLGILYLLFVWTFIPAFIAFIEGIIYLVQDDAKFARAQGLAYAP